jgi:hypothetical protein
MMSIKLELRFILNYNFYEVYLRRLCVLFHLLICFIGFYVTPSQFRSYGDVPALLVEKEDLLVPFKTPLVNPSVTSLIIETGPTLTLSLLNLCN